MFVAITISLKSARADEFHEMLMNGDEIRKAIYQQ
jgi:hypothetical protein